MPKILPWPDVTGARAANGGICIRQSKSRSTRCSTKLHFTVDGPRLAIDVKWSHDRKNIALFGVALMDLVNSKSKVKYERASVATQILDTKLFMYEAGFRSSLFPRYWWQLPYFAPDFVVALTLAIHMETLRPDTLVAVKDTRASVEATYPDVVKSDIGPRHLGDWKQYVDDVIAQRQVQVPESPS